MIFLTTKEYLTIVLQPRWGGVKKLYHLDTRKPVLCVQEIKPNEKYVVVGGDKLKYKKNGQVIPFRIIKHSNIYKRTQILNCKGSENQNKKTGWSVWWSDINLHGLHKKEEENSGVLYGVWKGLPTCP